MWDASDSGVITGILKGPLSHTLVLSADLQELIVKDASQSGKQNK